MAMRLPGHVAWALGRVGCRAWGRRRRASRRVTSSGGSRSKSRPRRDYDPLGVRLGGFRLDGFVEAGLGWDSNLFGRESNIKPTATGAKRQTSAEQRLERTAVGVSGSVDSRQYFSESAWTGRIGMSAASAATTSSALPTSMPVTGTTGSISTSTTSTCRPPASRSPCPIDSDEVQVSGDTRFNRVGLLGHRPVPDLSFQDMTLAGVTQPVSINDFDTVDRRPGRQATPSRRAATSPPSCGCRTSTTPKQHLQRPRQLHLGGAGRLRVRFRRGLAGPPRLRLAAARLPRPNHQDAGGPGAGGAAELVADAAHHRHLQRRRTIEESIRLDAVSYQRTTAASGWTTSTSATSSLAPNSARTAANTSARARPPPTASPRSTPAT